MTSHLVERDEPADARLAAALAELRRTALELEDVFASTIAVIAEPERASARNLVHYLALRRKDLRDLQRDLAERGLSSIGRAEAHVLATLDAVLARLGEPPVAVDGHLSFADSKARHERHATQALGTPGRPGGVRLMVTLPSEAATDAKVVDGLVEAGMDLARINCAHDGPDEWRAMAAHVRDAAARAGREVRVAFDLAGPKLRTGELEPGPRVRKIRPDRGVDGAVQRPARVRFCTAPAGIDDPTAVPVVGDLLLDADVDDEIVLVDGRGRRRRLRIDAATDGHAEAACDRTTYLATGLELQRQRRGGLQAKGSVGDLPATEPFIRLSRGDRLSVRRGAAVGRPAELDDGQTVEPAIIGCELETVFGAVAVGDRVVFDDGRIHATVVEAGADTFDVVVDRPARAKLKAHKGMNLPDTSFVTPALTDHDLVALAVVAPIADLVSLSFVRTVDDAIDLRTALDRLGLPELPIGLKIEHAAGFAALPALLLYGLQRPPTAVMLARGDLAIEVGFERLAEVQEEVLWLCEAAHTPVIWATQVAESMAKDGLPTRAEVTDAAWASRAECVMLNKGPHITDAIAFIDDVIQRMHQHQDKRTALLRRLAIGLQMPSDVELDAVHSACGS